MGFRVSMLGAWLVVGVALAGCAGPFGLTGSPQQLKELIQAKEAAGTCVKGVYAGITVTAIAVNVDKGLPGSTVMIDENCKATVTTGPARPAPATSP